MTDRINALLAEDVFAPLMLKPLPVPPNLAEKAIDAIYKEFADFEAALNSEQEIAMCIVGGPSGLTFHIRKVYRYGGDKLVFEGIDGENKPVRLMQHLMQLNLLMTAAPKLDRVAARIGFHSPERMAAH